MISFDLAFRPRLLASLKSYGKEDFRADLGAGLTVAAVALPLAMAFGIASGAKPEQGIFTAIIAGFLISALGGSRVQIGGPAGFTAVRKSFAAWAGMCACFGQMNSIGTFQAYISAHQLKDYSASAIGWIFSLYVFLAFFCGVQIGPVFDAKGPRLLVLAGSCLTVASLALLGNCTSTSALALPLSSL